MKPKRILMSNFTKQFFFLFVILVLFGPIYITWMLHNKHNYGTQMNCRKNVLFIVADDMRPQIGAYEGPNFPSPVHPKMITPNLDSLASKSLLLTRSYVQQASCLPSRSSFLTSRRPDTTHVYNQKVLFRKVGGNFTTLPQYFKEHGYECIGLGKIFQKEDPLSWTMPFIPSNKSSRGHENSWYAVSQREREINPLPDEETALYTIKMLRNLAPQALSGEKPIFLAVGFKKPHLPMLFPEEFQRYYPTESIHPPHNPFPPEKMPEVAWNAYGELRSYGDIARLGVTGDINTTIPINTTIQLRRAYYSSVSYVDFLVGTILAELARLGLEQSTIVSFIGDHGWHLGENGEWTKHTNFEKALHAPMMIHIPGVTDQGIVSDELVEFVDLYPTLAEAASLPKLPTCPIESSHIPVCTEGTSLIPLATGKYTKWKQFAFSQWRRRGMMGYSVRTDRYRYTEWPKFMSYPVYKPLWNISAGVELYDHEYDPEENHNVADKSEYAGIRSHLSLKLHQGWRYV